MQTGGILLWHGGESGSHLREIEVLCIFQNTPTSREVFPGLSFNKSSHSRTEFVTIMNQDLGARILKSQG